MRSHRLTDQTHLYQIPNHYASLSITFLLGVRSGALSWELAQPQKPGKLWRLLWQRQLNGQRVGCRALTQLGSCEQACYQALRPPVLPDP